MDTHTCTHIYTYADIPHDYNYNFVCVCFIYPCSVVVQIGFEHLTYDVSEGAGQVEVCVELLKGRVEEIVKPVQFRLSTIDGTATGNYSSTVHVYLCYLPEK